MTRRKPLSSMVAESLSQKILAGELEPGAQLPTEAELCVQFDVSRTVIREAVARLRSDGLVIPHQGRGVFVSDNPAGRNFSIPEDALKTLPETIALLELRLSIEVEAAGLCASRRTDAEATGIRRLMEQVDGQQGDPESVGIHYDYDFHLAIAKSARNEFIHAFLSYLRPILVPRYRLRYVVKPASKGSYYAQIHREHNAIVTAIEKQDDGAARRAMRKHLMNSLERVRALALASGIETSGGQQVAAAAALFSDLRPRVDGGR